MPTIKTRKSYIKKVKLKKCQSHSDIKNDTSLKNLWAILSNTPEAMMLLDSHYNIILYNERAVAVMQKFTGENIAINRNLITALPEFRRSDVRNKLDTVRCGSIVEYEVEYYDNNWLRVSFVPVKEKDGTVNEICLTIRDITGYKSIERKLQKKVLEYHSLVDSLAEGVIYQSLDKKIVKCNSSAERILGIKEKKLKLTGFPLPGWKLYSRKKEEINFSDFLTANKESCRSTRDFIIGIRKNKNIQWLSLNIEPVKDKKNGVKACVISFVDITLQEKQKRDMKILLLAAAKISNSVIVTNPNRQLIWANAAFTENTGFSFEEVKGKVPGHFLQGKETDPKTIKYMRQRLRQNLPFECEIQNYKKNGEKFWMRINVQPLFNEDGSINGYIGVGANITEQKKLQAKLLHQKVEQQKEITRATIAGQEKERNELGRELHDNINQILAATKIQLQCFRKTNATEDENITNSLNYLDIAIQELRNLSRQLVAPRFHETKLIDEINLMIENLGLKEKTKFEAGEFERDKVSPDVKLTLFRILQEQFNNIIKYAQAKSILVKLKTNGTGVELLIKDDGIGFDTTQKRNGIGLNNIHNRVELHGGWARISSAPGKGCHLHISIPFEKT
jgi:PAS domain S-box-containing protein